MTEVVVVVVVLVSRKRDGVHSLQVVFGRARRGEGVV